jgi:probable rRNA maturation factor
MEIKRRSAGGRRPPLHLTKFCFVGATGGRPKKQAPTRIVPRIIIEHHSHLRHIPDNKKIHEWITQTLENKICTEITIRIVNKKESAFFNENYRNKKGPTNVLSFVYQTNPVYGDIVLCAPLIRDEEIWAHLVVHGILHLMGYDHINSTDAKKMESLEIKILKKLGFNNPYLTQEI